MAYNSLSFILNKENFYEFQYFLIIFRINLHLYFIISRNIMMKKLKVYIMF